MIYTSTGCCLSIGPVAGTSVLTASDFEALTYTEISQIQDLGEFGDAAEDLTVVFQKWRWTEMAVTLGLIFVVSLRKEWPMTFIAVRCPHPHSGGRAASLLYEETAAACLAWPRSKIIPYYTSRWAKTKGSALHVMFALRRH